MASDLPFSRPTILAAVATVSPDTRAAFAVLMLELGLEETTAGTGQWISDMKASFAEFCVRNPDFETPHGPVAEVVVRAACEAIATRPARPWVKKPDAEQYRGREFSVPSHIKLLRSLERDGFTLDRSGLRRVLPEQVDLPAADDEVRHLLDKFGFSTAKGHLDQAIDAHTRGNWASSNGQLP